MNRTASVNLTKILSWLAAIIMALVPFHAFLTVWLSSLTHHYTLLRLWKEFLLAPIAIGAIYLLLTDRRLIKKFFSIWLVQLIFAYFGLLIICGLAAFITHNVSAKALWYGLLVDSRFLVFFLAVLAISAKTDWLEKRWQKLLLAPAILVAAFAILQFLVLPYDFMKHFGYNQSTIFPYETINHNIQHLRVMSTLRGANPLGAYLIIPVSALTVWLFRERRERLDKLMFGSGLLLALIFSFSRSAWLGAALSATLVFWLTYRSFETRKIFGWWLIGVLVAIGLLGVLLRNNLGFENAVFHTDRQSTISVSSNEGHSSAFKSAASDIWHHPLGSGVGTAGPQSYYNGQNTKLAENYFLQIGQEAGIIGMILFIWICVSIGHLLYTQRASPMAVALFASLVGLSLINLLSHAWSDDTLAYVWWGLAGIALAPILTDKLKQKDGQKVQKSKTSRPIR